jgi:hypothetical protein
LVISTRTIGSFTIKTMLPGITLEFLCSELSELNPLWEAYRLQSENRDWHLDFKAVSRLTSEFTLCLFEVGYELLGRGHRFALSWPTIGAVSHSYLDSSLSELLKNGLQSPVHSKHLDTNNGLLCWRIEREWVVAFAYEAHGLLERHFEGYDLHPVQYGFTELLMNVFDHSGAIAAYALLQYNGDTKMISMIVGDLGVGMHHKVNQTLESRNLPPMEAAEAIEQAFAERFSSQSHFRNRGVGLSTIWASFAPCATVAVSVAGWKHKRADTSGGLMLESKPYLAIRPGTLLSIELNGSRLALIDSNSAFEL